MRDARGCIDDEAKVSVVQRECSAYDEQGGGVESSGQEVKMLEMDTLKRLKRVRELQ